jgi:hypothetical protein
MAGTYQAVKGILFPLVNPDYRAGFLPLLYDDHDEGAAADHRGQFESTAGRAHAAKAATPRKAGGRRRNDISH